VTPSLGHRFHLRVTGKDYDGGWKDYAHEVFDEALRHEVGD
jgi:hypothetical protein